MERINFHFSVLVILFVSAAILGAISVASENREHNKISEEKEVPTLKIVAFGNSITAVRSNVQEVFAQRLPALLKDIGIEAIVVNAGIGGSHSGRLVDNDRIKVKHALDRFESAVLDEKPDLVIIGFGHNDSH
ncbi:MAG TPA: GDSL-type esterase/lipase family protein, partial [Sphingobacterium sp.]|nr:GDSL-type esterase/lipase family protein [Sphingobacterium sp.]